MKRVVSVFLTMVILVILGVSTFSVASGESGGYLWMVDAPNGVSIRSAKKGGDYLGFLRKGEIVRVIEEDNYWVGIPLSDGTVGYVYKADGDLHIAHAEEIEAWEKKKKAGIKVTNEDAYFVGVIVQECRVYKKANGKVIGKYEADDIVYIRQLGKFWYKIIWNGKEIGYVQTKNIKLLDLNIPFEGEPRVLKDDEDYDNSFVIREEPDRNSKKVAMLPEMTYVRLIEEIEDSKWALIAYNANGDMGYIAKNWLRKTRLFDD